MTKRITCKVRNRPPLFSSPGWQEKTESGDTLPATELWRDLRAKYEDWEIGIEGYPEIIRLFNYGRATHLAFYLEDLLRNPKLFDTNMIFDAGTSCSELVIELEEWKRVANELDIMSRYLALHSTDEPTQAGTE